MNRIAELRRATGLTQDELGRRVRVSVRTVASWEAGMSVPRQRNARALAKALGRSVVDLALDDSESAEADG